MVSPAPAHAQYFGRNKVNYQTFDFRILRAPHFDLYFYPAESLATTDAARMAERWYARLSPFMRHEFSRRSIMMFADQADFQQNNITDIESEGTGGVTEGFRERVLLPFTGSYADDDHVLGHELVHVFQYDIAANPTKGGGAGGGNGANGSRRQRGAGLNALPLWLVEGMAEYLSLGRDDPNTAMWLRDAARRKDIPTIRQLTNNPRYFPYRYGQALWAYVGGRWGDRAVVDVYRTSLDVGFERSIKRVLGISADSLSKEWAAAIRSAYLPVLAGRTTPESTATRVVFQRSKRGGEYNTSPVVSPDGQQIAYFSSSGLFGIEIFIADATTGRVVRQLGSVNTPRHYDALSFVNSAGSWSPDARRLAYVVYRKGDQVLEVYDVERGRVERRITAPGVGAVLHPAWSPDGRYIAFSAVSGGISDLYLYDFTTDRSERLTSGRNAELQPAWSPDSRTIVFATDRGDSTDLERLTFGPIRLAVMDLATRNVRLLPRLTHGKAIDPQYSADGRSIYFIGDPDGIPDVYRVELETGALYRVTRVATGVGGITSLSPAISVARATGRLVFSVFDRQGYDVLRLDGASALGQAVPAGADSAPALAGMLPPAQPAMASEVAAYRADPLTGLPPSSTTFAVAPYHSSLHLDYIAPPTVGASFGGPFGTQLGGGIAGSFSDQLGDHNLMSVVQIQGELRDAGGQLVYQNLRRRWNYGAAISRIPYQTGYAYYSSDAAAGSLTYNQILQRIYVNQLAVFAQYPFSPSRRFEVALTGTRQSYAVDQYQYMLDAYGNPLNENRVRGAAPPALSYAQASAALVGDYSYFGFTSPVAGGRYRFEVAPTAGQLTFTTATADYRRYMFVRPFTFAVRALHYGRYGRDAEDSTRLLPLYLGYPSLVRGYDINSITTAECTTDASSGAAAIDCPVFNRLSGSRLAVASAEFRIPLLGTEAFGLLNARFLPLEVAPFVDAGLAWSGGQTPTLHFLTGSAARTSSDRTPVASAGVSARLNLFGYAVVEGYYAHPFQRPDARTQFGVQLAPGW